MNEWEFIAEVAGWINEILARNISLQFSSAKCEHRGKGSLRRRDLTLPTMPGQNHEKKVF